MAIARSKVTEQEFMGLPSDGHKYELVDGDVKVTPAGFKHDAICARLIALLHPFARTRGYLTGYQAGFRMSSGNIRCPDVAFTLADRLAPGDLPSGFVDFAPDLAIEVLSPTDDAADLPRKVGEYSTSGTQAVWLVAPDAGTVTVYLSPSRAACLQGDDTLDGGALLAGLSLTVRDIFAVEPEAAG